MRNVAREMNLSETAFLVPRDGEFHLRWLTPAVEVDLCGHATVASAHVLWEDGHLPPGAQARFHTRSGLLTADQRGDWIELDFPVKIATVAEPPGRVAARVGNRVPARGGEERLRLPGGDRIGGRTARAGARPLDAAQNSGARSHCYGAVFHARVRFHLALLRAGLGRR